MSNIEVIIPVKNEEINLPYALASVKEWADKVWVVDCGSTDRTSIGTSSFLENVFGIVGITQVGTCASLNATKHDTKNEQRNNVI